MSYQLDFVPVGTMVVPGPEVFWMKHFNESFDLRLWIAVIRGEGRIILVNTGCSSETADMYGMDDVTAQGGISLLNRLGVQEDEVTDIVITPFQAYAIGQIDHFPNATIHLSRRGWIDFHAPKRRNHPHDIRYQCIPEDILKYLVVDAWDRVHLLDDEDIISPGVNVFWTGGHHRSSVAVCVETQKGLAILSDAMFYLENITDMIPIGISESLEESLTAYERIRKEAAFILPLYDPRCPTIYEK